MTVGRCLCGDHRFRIEGDLVFMHHCHCSYCRKMHGSAYSTMIGVAPENIHWDAAGERIEYAASGTVSSPGSFVRRSCGRCGSSLPSGAEGQPTWVPGGLLAGDLGSRPEGHIFAGSKLPWLEIEDGLPIFDAFPPGIDAVPGETRDAIDPPGGVRGSCLCGQTRFVLDGPALAARHCHCLRCQRARGAAHASNLVVDAAVLRFTAGERQLRVYKVPEAKYFRQAFCGDCGSCMPRLDPGRGIAVVPLGCLDDPPQIAPQEHIWVESKAIWHAIEDALPQYSQGPPG